MLGIAFYSHKYIPIVYDDGSTEDGSSSKRVSTQHLRPVVKLIISLALVTVCFLSFWLGRLTGRLQTSFVTSKTDVAPTGQTSQSIPRNTAYSKIVPIGNTNLVFQHNDSFASIPVFGKAEPAWDSLIPSSYAPIPVLISLS